MKGEHLIAFETMNIISTKDLNTLRFCGLKAKGFLFLYLKTSLEMIGNGIHSTWLVVCVTVFFREKKYIQEIFMRSIRKNESEQLFSMFI